MCRHVAYLGPPVTLASLLYDPPHSLVRQSWAPREQRFGTINADGYGVGWYQPEVRAEPARFRRAGPMWADRSLESMARVVRSGAIVAAVRSATPPAPIEETGAAPFTAGRWLFSLNGVVAGGPAGLRPRVSARRQAGIEGVSDAEMLFALVLDGLDSGTSPAAILTELVAAVAGRLNMVLSDGVTIWATAAGDSLWWRTLGPELGPELSPGPGPGVLVVSEPLDDDPGWQPVPDRSLLAATAQVVACSPLPGPTETETETEQGAPAP